MICGQRCVIRGTRDVTIAARLTATGTVQCMVVISNMQSIQCDFFLLIIIIIIIIRQFIRRRNMSGSLQGRYKQLQSKRKRVTLRTVTTATTHDNTAFSIKRLGYDNAPILFAWSVSARWCTRVRFRAQKRDTSNVSGRQPQYVLISIRSCRGFSPYITFVHIPMRHNVVVIQDQMTGRPGPTQGANVAHPHIVR